MIPSSPSSVYRPTVSFPPAAATTPASGTQLAIQNSIASFSDDLQAGSGSDDQHLNNFQALLKQIKTSPDQGGVSAIFGNGTTNREQNIYLLGTILDNVNLPVSAALRGDMKRHLDAEVRELLATAHQSNFLSQAKAVEAQVYKDFESKASAPAGAAAPASTSPSASTPTSTQPSEPETRTVVDTVTIKNRQFEVESTTAGTTSAGRLAHDCLAYALQSSNSAVAGGYRAQVFSPINLARQLNRTHATMTGNAQPTVESIANLKATVNGDYAELNLETAGTIPEIATLLANHIQTSHCTLDAALAGGVFAAHLQQPIVFVSQTPERQLTFNVLNPAGELVGQGANGLDDAGILENAVFIRHNGHTHFERMTPVVAAQSAASAPAQDLQPAN